MYSFWGLIYGEPLGAYHSPISEPLEQEICQLRMERYADYARKIISYLALYFGLSSTFVMQVDGHFVMWEQHRESAGAERTEERYDQVYLNPRDRFSIPDSTLFFAPQSRS